MSKDILSVCNEFPPCLCRYVARTPDGYHGLTTRDLVSRSGLAACTVKLLSVSTNWNGITLSTLAKFMAACGVNPLQARRVREFARRRRMVHVQSAKGPQKALYQRIERLMIEEARKRRS